MTSPYNKPNEARQGRARMVWRKHVREREYSRKVCSGLIRIATLPRTAPGVREFTTDMWNREGGNDACYSAPYHLREAFLTAKKELSASRSILRAFVVAPRERNRLSNQAQQMLRNALRDWRPNKYRDVSLDIVFRGADQGALQEDGKVATINLSAANVMRRQYNKVPWFATDRFILTFDGCMEKTVLFDDVEGTVPCTYIDERMMYKRGWLARHHGFWGVAGREYDAVKAAKMKAVQHVTNVIMKLGEKTQ